MILRPYAIVLDGQLTFGQELILDSGVIRDVRPHTGSPEPYVVSPAFVNAHSHLEYRGLQDKVHAPDYWGWIREITELKKGEFEVRVRQECIAAAHENKKTGVALLAEHSDRPYAATAMLSAGLGGVVFQETITFFEQASPEAKLRQIRSKALEQAKLWRKPIFLTPHAYHTVDQTTLADFGRSGEPISIHVAETDAENQLTRSGSGPIGDFYRANGFDFQPPGKSVVEALADLGLVRRGTQFVHCCAIDGADIHRLAAGGVSVAHCPRSNLRLKCPPAPVREILDAGIDVGLGLDSPASSGAIDMFAEMRAALKVACDRGRPLLSEEVWAMATNRGAQSLGFALEFKTPWKIQAGANLPLIKINVPNAESVEDLIAQGSPAKIAWV